MMNDPSMRVAREITSEERAEMRARRVAAVAARPPEPPRPPPVSELIAKSRLLSVAPAVSFRWTPVQLEDGSPLDAKDKDIEAMFKLQHMTELDLRTTVGCYGLQAAYIARLLTNPCTRPLRSFLGGHIMDRQLIHMLEEHHGDLLERLWVQGAQTDHDLLPMLDTIPKLPHLTELHFGRATYGSDAALVALGNCKHLTTLGLRGNFTCTQGILRGLQTSGSRLRALRLIGAGGDSTGWGECFALVPTLEVLRLDRCGSPDKIIRALAAHCPALRTLLIHCGHSVGGAQPLLDPAVFDTLLSSALHSSQLRVTLAFEPLQPVLDEHIRGCRRSNGYDKSEEITSDWNKGKEMLELVASRHPKQIRFSIQDAPIN